LQATPTSLDLLRLVSAVTGEEPPYSDYITVDDLTADTFPREWRGLTWGNSVL
jgi:hypothetical protein